MARMACTVADMACWLADELNSFSQLEVTVSFAIFLGVSLLTYLLTKKKLTPQEINLNSLDMLRSGINTVSDLSDSVYSWGGDQGQHGT